MKILIPMAGKGKRFSDFLSPKPLIEIDGKPMIEHVLEYFPRNAEFIFACNEYHLETTDLKDVLARLAPNGRIVRVTDNVLGPAYTSLTAFDYIDDDEEVIVNYCDFIQTWDFNDFMTKVREHRPDGAIVSFRGFHPSSLGTTYYAYMKVNESGFITDLKEKESFSDDRTKDFASTGTYYFASGKLFKRYIKDLLSHPENAVKGEFYMSLPFKLMMRDGLKILNYEAEKFICLGTPRDYELYKFWSEFFLHYSPNFITFDNADLKVTNIFPLAGGERDFKALGFTNLNFMVPIMNKPALHYSLYSLPLGVRNIFLSLEENKDEFNPSFLPQKFRHNSEFIYLNEKKSGEAATILEAEGHVPEDHAVCVSGCTYILKYDERRLAHLMETDVDVILFSFSHHEWILRSPKSVHYAKVKDLINVTGIVAKDTISDTPYKDQALTGTAIFKQAKDLFWCLRQIETRGDRRPYFLSAVNYLIEKGKKVVIFEVDKIVRMRDVENYLEFVYWQDYFDNLSYHPYSRVLQ
ncbi:NTP transferase domain-containing protein [Candidatus Woesearchaeota archaeon]|nr:NTP transferase domain-containing protein [Candidatus Woesearchaeota archaeon]